MNISTYPTIFNFMSNQQVTISNTVCINRKPFVFEIEQNKNLHDFSVTDFTFFKAVYTTRGQGISDILIFWMIIESNMQDLLNFCPSSLSVLEPAFIMF